MYALGNLGNDGCCTGAGAATHTCGDEKHLGVVGDSFAYFVFVLQGEVAGALGYAAGTKSAKYYLVWHRARCKCFGIGVTDYEVHTMDALTVHVVDGIAAATTDTDYFDFGGLLLNGFKLHCCGWCHVLEHFIR